MWRERIAFYRDEEPRHKELLNPVLQAYVAWNVLYLALHAHEMSKEQQKELKSEMCHNFTSLFRKPHLYNSKESMKLALKCVLILINTDILRKRYVN